MIPTTLVVRHVKAQEGLLAKRAVGVLLLCNVCRSLVLHANALPLARHARKKRTDVHIELLHVRISYRGYVSRLMRQLRAPQLNCRIKGSAVILRLF